MDQNLIFGQTQMLFYHILPDSLTKTMENHHFQENEVYQWPFSIAHKKQVYSRGYMYAMIAWFSIPKQM